MLTIGEFSRLSRVTPRMLRHYDALGLLRPEAPLPGTAAQKSRGTGLRR